MIKQITLKCFRRHEDLEVNLTPGLNVIRGANEMGKTTLLEAVLYALYGSKALRNSFEDVVTHGHKENELKTAVVISIEGIDYVYKRSKAGAEVTFADEAGMPRMVTGQTEVSKFSAELLGADLKAASAMMLASQNSLRGALDEGPAAVSMLMAKLADFDLIDRVLENANSQLALGMTTMMQTRAAEMQTKILQAATDNITESTVVASEVAAEAERSFCEAMEPYLQAEAKALQLAEDAIATSNRHEYECSRVATECGNLINDIEAKLAETQRAEAEAKDAVADSVLTELQAKVSRERDREAAVQAFNIYNSTPFPEVAWDQPEESFVRELAAAQASAEDLLKVGLLNKEAELLSAKSQLMTSGTCPTCGHDKNDPEHVAHHNAEVTEKIRLAQAGVDSARAAYGAKAYYRDALLDVRDAAARYLRRLSPLGERLSFDPSCYPPRASWVGETPAFAADGAPLRELALAQQKNAVAARAAGRFQALSAEVAGLKVRHGQKVAQLTALYAESKDANVLKAARESAQEAYAAVKLAWDQQKARWETARAEAVRSRQRYTQEQATLEQCKEQLEKYQADIKRMDFNNTFVNKLRKMKPAITDFLWNQVLSAVSKFFSDMRGVQSMVTKETNGFMVNGKPIESLSGSTLDVLALAIRCALVKTFIPHANFLVLDEPAAGCDVDRTGNVLGFVASVGFGQVIMASHDVLSESVADNVVRIGE